MTPSSFPSHSSAVMTGILLGSAQSRLVLPLVSTFPQLLPNGQSALKRWSSVGNSCPAQGGRSRRSRSASSMPPIRVPSEPFLVSMLGMSGALETADGGAGGQRGPDGDQQQQREEENAHHGDLRAGRRPHGDGTKRGVPRRCRAEEAN